MKQFTKIYALASLLLCSGASAYAQDNLSVIQGKWIGEAKARKMGLYAVENGALNELATSQVNRNLFSFAFTPEKEGYYVISGDNPRASTYRYIFYFKPGDDLDLELEEDTYRLTGKQNTPENQAIERWHEVVQPLEGKAVYFMGKISTYKDFFPLLESKLKEISSLPKANTKNERFNASFEDYKTFDLLHIALMFLNTPRTEHPQSKDYIDFYRHVNLQDLTRTTAILDYPDGIDLIDQSYLAGIRANPSIPKDKIGGYMRRAQDAILEQQLVTNDTLKGELVLDGTQTIKTYPGIMEYKQKYARYLITDDQQKRFNEIVARYDDNSAGHEAIDFRFQDVNGKQVALSDFKGKVVYVDVWATWCGPCKGEIPHLIKLEEAYHDNPDIVFMSVSVDKSKDIDKWKQMLKDKGMGGVQLFAGDRSDEVMSPYKIKGIPRFMLFDKDGKVINADAPRPSSSEIKAVLDAALKK